jgi:tetratricopeptide (TPR) repeat protein
MGLSSLWGKLSRNPESALAQARQKLDEILPGKCNSFPWDKEAWACYRRALVAARKCGGDAVTSLVLEFDPRFPSEPATGFPLCDPYLGPALISQISSAGPLPLYRALKVLLANKPIPDQALEAANRLAIRLGDIDQIRRVERITCLSLATRGDSDRLVSKLFERRGLGRLTRPEIEEVVSAYLSAHRFDIASPWAGFFAQLSQDELPRIREVSELLDAADAELRYLLQCPGTEAARRAVTLSEAWIHKPGLAIKAHHHAGEAFFQEADYLTAARHFLNARDEVRASDCYLLAGRIPDALGLRQVSSAWLATVGERTDQVLREFVQQGASIDAIRLVRSITESLRGALRVKTAKDNGEYIRSEVLRLEGILDGLVRTARASLTEESRNAGPGAEVFRRWSAIEEAVGNFLEAGLQAELGQDYATASLMFKKAKAFEQARRAFDRASRSDLERLAELLERSGEFSEAGSLYQHLGQTKKASEMFDEEIAQHGFASG